MQKLLKQEAMLGSLGCGCNGLIEAAYLAF